MRKPIARFIAPVPLFLALLILAGASPAAAQGETPAPTVQLSFPITGTVEETFEANIYTYMKVKGPGNPPLWVIATPCVVKRGDKLEVSAGKLYEQVDSDTLGITFDRLVVATQLKLNGTEMKGFSAHDLPPGCAIPKPEKK